MQILVRGSETYFVEAEDVATVLEAVRAREGAEEVLLYAAGRPLEAEDSLEGVEAIDVNVPLKGGKVRSADKLKVDEEGVLTIESRLRSETAFCWR